MKIEIKQLSELNNAVKKIIANSQDKRLWIFEGEMGAGKTTLIKALCDELDVVDVVSSPTFSIVNEYKTKQDETIYHFDFYRLKDEEEAMDIGVEEYFYSGNYCFIEWPSVVPGILPDDCLKIEIVQKDEYLREVQIN